MKTIIAFGCALFVGTATQAATFNEVGDAGSTFATAQAVTDGTTNVAGFLDHTTDQFITDMFAFSVAAETELTINADAARVAETGLSIDPVLFLMDANRNLLVADDDGGPGINSEITKTLDAGDYFVAIGRFSSGAFASLSDFLAGDAFFEPFIGTANGPFASQVGVIGTTGSPIIGNESGAYEISFSEAVSAGTVAAVPLPAGLPLLLAGLGAIGVAARRKRELS